MQPCDFELSHQTDSHCYNRPGPVFPGEIRSRQVQSMRASQSRVSKMLLKIKNERHHLGWVIGQEGEVLEGYATFMRGRKAILKFLRSVKVVTWGGRDCSECPSR